MNRRIFVLIYLCITHSYLYSQTLPKEDAVINYRLVGFSYPEKQEVGVYKIQIAAGNYYDEGSFKKNIILSLDSKQNRIIGEVPAFGKQYTWRVVYQFLGSHSKKSELWHFSTGSISRVDTSTTRLKILNNTGKYKNAYVFLDGSRTLYDMNGSPVWFLPAIDGTEVRDMRLTSWGTITFLNNDKICEINYNGDILWTGPNSGVVSGDTSEHYHHEFTRLSNGHYMVLGNEKLSPPVDVAADSTAITDAIPYGTIIEYDGMGNLIWSWKAFPYFKESDLKYYKSNGREKDLRRNNAINVHPNAFYFDERNQVVYIGFRNISRILKIKYPEGNVIETYGEVYKPGKPATGNTLFCGQHAMSVSQNGNLLLFNNNSCNEYALPELLLLHSDPSAPYGVNKVWEYTCVIDSSNETKQSQNPFSSNGDVIELPDQSLFAYMSGGAYSRLFIVNQDKEILWSASAEEWDVNEKKWRGLLQYRASIISSTTELEHLVWGR